VAGGKCKHSPNTVLITIGTDLNWRGATTAHKLKMSRGIGGRCMGVACGRKDAIVTTDLASARAPKYTAMILFPKVSAYTLG